MRMASQPDTHTYPLTMELEREEYVSTFSLFFNFFFFWSIFIYTNFNWSSNKQKLLNPSNTINCRGAGQQEFMFQKVIQGGSRPSEDSPQILVLANDMHSLF